ncbi:MAG: outer membrane lipoprotein carrier protein LolA [Deltaproteobacteria bacterium]|nr:outer membrane lipoprotein carrier protein LolA [Deltaproteobacteria bacterium]
MAAAFAAVLTLSAAAAAPPIPLSPAATETLLGDVSRRMGAVRSFEADFTQEHHLSLYLDVLRARGVSYFQAPDRFRWELLEPYRSILVYNRTRVAKFEDRDGKMRFVDSGAYDVIRGLMGQMTGWMRGDFQAARDSFAMRALEGSDYEIELTPRSREMLTYIQRIEVHLKKEPLQVSRIVIREPEQDYIEIRFGTVRENVALRGEFFDTKSPLATQTSRETR